MPSLFLYCLAVLTFCAVTEQSSNSLKEIEEILKDLAAQTSSKYREQNYQYHPKYALQQKRPDSNLEDAQYADFSYRLNNMRIQKQLEDDLQQAVRFESDRICKATGRCGCFGGRCGKSQKTLDRTVNDVEQLLKELNYDLNKPQGENFQIDEDRPQRYEYKKEKYDKQRQQVEDYQQKYGYQKHDYDDVRKDQYNRREKYDEKTQKFHNHQQYYNRQQGPYKTNQIYGDKEQEYDDKRERHDDRTQRLYEKIQQYNDRRQQQNDERQEYNDRKQRQDDQKLEYNDKRQRQNDERQEYSERKHRQDDRTLEYDDKRQRQDDRTLEYDDRRQRHNDRKQEYDDRQQRYHDLTQEYDDKRQRQDDRTLEYNEKRQRHDYRIQEYNRRQKQRQRHNDRRLRQYNGKQEYGDRKQRQDDLTQEYDHKRHRQDDVTQEHDVNRQGQDDRTLEYYDRRQRPNDRRQRQNDRRQRQSKRQRQNDKRQRRDDLTQEYNNRIPRPDYKRQGHFRTVQYDDKRQQYDDEQRIYINQKPEYEDRIQEQNDGVQEYEDTKQQYIVREREHNPQRQQNNDDDDNDDNVALKVSSGDNKNSEFDIIILEVPESKDFQNRDDDVNIIDIRESAIKKQLQQQQTSYDRNGKKEQQISSVTLEDFVKYYEKTKREISNGLLKYIKGLGDDSYLSQLLPYQKNQIEYLKNRQSKWPLTDSELKAKIIELLFGMSSHIKLLPHSEDGQTIYIPQRVHNAIPAQNVNNALRSHKRLFPLTFYQKQRQRNLIPRNIILNHSWRRNNQQIPNYGVPFELQVQGLGQIN